MGNSGSSGGGSRKARSLPNSPEAHRYPRRVFFFYPPQNNSHNFNPPRDRESNCAHTIKEQKLQSLCSEYRTRRGRIVYISRMVGFLYYYFLSARMIFSFLYIYIYTSLCLDSLASSRDKSRFETGYSVYLGYFLNHVPYVCKNCRVLLEEKDIKSRFYKSVRFSVLLREIYIYKIEIREISIFCKTSFPRLELQVKRFNGCFFTRSASIFFFFYIVFTYLHAV